MPKASLKRGAGSDTDQPSIHLSGRRSRSPPTHGKTTKILLAIDGSLVTKRMLSYVAAHDELFGPSHDYTVVNVVAQVPGYAARFLDQTILDDYYREEAEQVSVRFAALPRCSTGNCA